MEISKINNQFKIDSQTKILEKDISISRNRINLPEVKDLVFQLNKSLNPFNTSIKFGYDNNSEDFYISVIEAKTNNILRRFPAEEGFGLLPKIKELTGIIFDETV